MFNNIYQLKYTTGTTVNQSRLSTFASDAKGYLVHLDMVKRVQDKTSVYLIYCVSFLSSVTHWNHYGCMKSQTKLLTGKVTIHFAICGYCYLWLLPQELGTDKIETEKIRELGRQNAQKGLSKNLQLSVLVHEVPSSPGELPGETCYHKIALMGTRNKVEKKARKHTILIINIREAI